VSAINPIKNNQIDKILILLFFLFPITLVSVKIIGNLILLVLTLLGLMRAVREKINPFSDKRIKYFSYISVGYFLIMLFSIILSTGISEDISHIARKLHFLLAPLIAIAFLEKTFSLKESLFSLKIFIPILAIAMLFESLFTGHSRPSGMLNTNVFSDLVVILTFISIANIFHEEKFDLLLSLVSAGSGLYIIILNWSRGSWLVFIVLLFLLIFLSYQGFKKRSSKKNLLFLMSLLISIIFLNNNFIYKNVTNSISNIDLHENSYSSSGYRLEMWKSSMDALPEMPWHGYGYRLANKEVAKYSKNHKQSVEVATHLHNEYITHLMSAGVFGLVGLFSIMFLPAYLFFRQRNNINKVLTARIGIMICLGYSIIGITHIAFGEEHVNALYVFYLALLSPRINNNI